jgi:hypothetical protein
MTAHRLPSGRRFIAVLFTCALALISSGDAAYALDPAGHGGIVTGVTSNGSSGFLTARVANPFGVPVSGYINFTTQNSNGTTTTVTVNYTLLAYGSQNFSGSPNTPFTSSTIGAAIQDSTGMNTATGWGNSYVNNGSGDWDPMNAD